MPLTDQPQDVSTHNATGATQLGGRSSHSTLAMLTRVSGEQLHRMPLSEPLATATWIIETTCVTVGAVPYSKHIVVGERSEMTGHEKGHTMYTPGLS
jgi:hypothetical protein